MKVPWPGNRCILCLQETQLCEEHLIPDALGGRLTCAFLCLTCNSLLGSKLEASARSDPSILLAAQNLSGEIPELSRQLIESYPYIGQSEPGPVPGYICKGKFQVKSRQLEDDSIIQPTDKGRKSLVKMLQKLGYKDAPIRQMLAAFDQAPENVKVELIPGLEVVKWTVQRIEPDLTKGPLMNLRIPVKVAFEFLALHLGLTIYTHYPQLTAIRQALLGQQPENHVFRVERLFSGEYSPFHGIAFERNDPYAQVQLRLFGWLAFRVHFINLFVGGPRFVYTHQLDSGEERVAIIDNHKKQNYP